MNKIHQLSESLRSKLAAGEIIERPAYIVKELIDNAIDADAKTIRIDLEKSGLQKITVTDDGHGMSREDLEMSFKRYTTSKIISEDDLEKIVTMGFRGEALASISAVATVTIKSREKDAISGYAIVIQNGNVESLYPKGMPVGTQVKVENIFESIPVRKKFLRASATEYREIIEIITRYVLAFPAIRFDVYHDNKKVYLLVPSTVEDRLKHIFSEEIFSQFIPFNLENEYISLAGFTSKPQLAYKSSRHVYLFINNRYIVDKTLVAAIKEIYGTLLEPTSFPHIVLFITIPSHLIDVNVHPRKEEIHFVNNQLIINNMQDAIKQALSEANLRFYDKRWKGDSKEFDNWQIRDGGTNSYAAKTLKHSLKNTLLNISKDQTFFQFHNLYIAMPTDEGILFFDQHAVHERILYEQLQHNFQKEIKSGKHIVLKEPLEIQISQQELLLIEQYQDLLSAFGFQFEIKEEEIVFLSIPLLLQDKNIAQVLRELVDEFFEKGEGFSFDSMSHKMIAYLACRNAVKAGDSLTQKQCRELIEQLTKTENPYTCPHGRPTQVEMNLSYFHKLFKRT